MSSSKHSIEEKQIIEEPNSADTTDPDAEFGGLEERQRLERKLLWKLDCRMSILIIIYILNYIDRNNAAAARLRGFEADLHLKGQEFNTLLSILSVGYILMQIPSNMFLNHIGRPSLYLPVCMTIWGMISVLTGITKGFIGALLTRFFIGFVEAAFFPGALFILSKWYTRSELGLRICILYCGNIISNAFGSLMASGILDGMEGKLGKQAWRWLFFIEGAITIAVAFAAIFILPDFPTTTRWLTPLERSLALRRMAEDGGIKIDDEEGAEVLSQNPEGALGSTIVPKNKLARLTRHGRGFWLAVGDWKVWWLAVAFTAEVTALSFNAFFPTLTATLGFNSTITLILAAPPWFVTAIAAFFNARHSDKHGERFWHIISPLFVGIIGFIIAISTMELAARYIALWVSPVFDPPFLMSLSYVGYIVMFAWISNSIPRPPSKRAVALAFINCTSQLGNVAGSRVGTVLPELVWDLHCTTGSHNHYVLDIQAASEVPE
ncbi:MFS general substrate transporter [Fomitiporia mediterranea MF3/22]|uniref:MFS general substrate transporter n=1 Tax=Fomitiporia mediterranea (strain MF3/22) TaxID=694068 RepID=UPI0004408417|nr:MFS general substrate transporter [Fomitiporia mediterranea MF3/22]EJD01117.1 MFS general substrate transporter [Fomitiporia mediterranea MF3/22]